MNFLDLFILFCVYILGLYHCIVGAVGIVTGTPILYPAPYTLNRPTLYLMILGLLFLNPIFQAIGPTAAYVIFGLIVVDLIYEIVRPVVMPAVEIVGAAPDLIDSDLRRAFSQLSIKYGGEYPIYKLRDPYARLSVKYRKRLGIGEIRIFPRSQKRVLEEIAHIVAKDLDSREQSKPTRGYIIDLWIGIALLALGFWRLGSFLAQ